MATASNWREKLRKVESKAPGTASASDALADSETLAKRAITAKSPSPASAGTLPKLPKGAFGINGSFGNDPENQTELAGKAAATAGNALGTSSSGLPLSDGPPT